jgi:monofunctional biosynthetic peptidoglycan transglycosylase
MLFLVMGVAMLVDGARGDQHMTLVDFGANNPDLRMGITDDGVMGGLSKGEVEVTEQGTAVFSGTLSLENNGGFSSLRIQGGDWNLEGWNGIVLKVRGDGRTYDLRLTTDERFQGSAVSFRGKFKTVRSKWTTVKVSFSDLRASWRGRSLDTKFDPARIEDMGIILADKKAGPFSLEMEWMKSWK